MFAQRETGSWRLRCAGIDITSNVNFRMTTPLERAIFAAGGAQVPDGFEEKIASRLASIRDEAIWQYHVECQRGAVLWYPDQTFHFVLGSEWQGLLPELLDYDPTEEALVLAQDDEAERLFRIGPEGQLVLLRSQQASSPDLVIHADGEL